MGFSLLGTIFVHLCSIMIFRLRLGFRGFFPFFSLVSFFRTGLLVPALVPVLFFYFLSQERMLFHHDFLVLVPAGVPALVSLLFFFFGLSGATDQ